MRYTYAYNGKNLCLVDDDLKVYDLIHKREIGHRGYELYDRVKSFDNIGCYGLTKIGIDTLFLQARDLKGIIDRDVALYIPKNYMFGADLLFIGKRSGVVLYRSGATKLMGFFGFEYMYDKRMVIFNETDGFFTKVCNLWLKRDNDIELVKMGSKWVGLQLFDTVDALVKGCCSEVGARSPFFGYLFEGTKDISVYGSMAYNGKSVLAVGNKDLFREISKVIQIRPK